MNMKKIVCTLFCALTLTLTGCGYDIPALNEISVDTIQTLNEELPGCSRDDLIKVWGEPNMLVTTLSGDIWDLGGELETLLNVYYNGDNTYNSALISYQLAYTGTVTEIAEPTGEATTRTVTVQLDDGTTVKLNTTTTTIYTGADELAVGNKANFLCNAMTGSQYVWIYSAEILG